MKDALHWKANKVDVEDCLWEFISVSRIQEIYDLFEKRKSNVIEDIKQIYE